MNTSDLIAVLPFAILLLMAGAMLLLDLFSLRKGRLIWLFSASIGALILCWPQSLLRETAFFGLLNVDGASWLLQSLIIVGLLLATILHEVPLSKQKVSGGIDIDVLMVFAACGAMVMVSAANLLVLFVGFELLSVSVYALAAMARDERGSAEAALKYFVLGAFSSAFLLYGIMLVYGAVGSLSLEAVSLALTSESLLAHLGLALMLFGLGFKVSLVPFHVWTPDVYQGSPNSVAAFMATVVKVAAFGALLRVVTAFMGAEASWSGLFWILALITMTLGNLAAIRQKSVKRMLAYSSIAHAGYLLIGFLALPSGSTPIVFYLGAYLLATFSAFAVVLLISAGTEHQYDRDDLRSLSGLGWRDPFLGFAMTVAMMSLAGIPPLAGFVSKFFVFTAALEAGFVGLVIVAALNSLLSLYYYLRVPVIMFFGKDEDEVSQHQSIKAVMPRFALGFCLLATVCFGLFPGPAYSIIETSLGALSW